MVKLKTYNYRDLNKAQLDELCKRNLLDESQLNDVVADIINNVRTEGDTALYKYALELDKVKIKKLTVDLDELQKLGAGIGDEEKSAIKTAFHNINKFHESQLIKESKIETTKGVTCWRENRAVEKVGLYIPGGNAVLLSTFLMLAIPAKIAGCKEIVVCSPPQKDGTINAPLAYCALLCGIDKIYLIGGAQAIAAMAYGTETIPKVNKIFGPGNQYVTKAKSLVMADGVVAIDIPAGPTEVLIIADETSNPAFVASDLLAQAEHSKESRVLLITTERQFIEKVLNELERQMKELENDSIIEISLANSYAIVVSNLDEAIEFSNKYAPEHLIIATEKYERLISMINSAGSVFLGNYTPEAAGDYASGTNHTLPTAGFASSCSGVSVDSFIKKITFQKISKEGIKNLGNTIETLATLEGLQGHKNSVSIRLAALANQE